MKHPYTWKNINTPATAPASEYWNLNNDKVYTKLKNAINNQKWLRDLLFILEFTDATEEQENILIDIYKNKYGFWIKEYNIKMEIWELHFNEKKYNDSYFLHL